jgi:MFS family permease
MYQTLFCSASSLTLTIRYSRSLSRYSETYLHVHENQSFHSHLNYWMLFILSTIFFSNSLLITSAIPLYYNYFHSQYSPLGLSLLFSLYGLFLMIGSPLTSYIIDRRGPKTPLLYGLLSLILSLILFILSFNFQHKKSHGYGLLLIAQASHGLASALITNSGTSLITMAHAHDIRIKAMNLLTSLSLLGFVLGPLLSGYLYESINALAVYLPPTCLITISFLSYLTIYNGGHAILINEMTDEDAEIAIGLLPTSTHSHHHTSTSSHHATSMLASSLYGKQRVENFYSFLHIFSNRYHLITFIASMLSTLLLGVFFPLSPIYLHEQFHLTVSQQGLMISLLLLSISLASPLLGYFIQRPASASSSLSDNGLSYQAYKPVHSSAQLTSLNQYQAIYIGLLIIGLALCCVVWIKNLYLLEEGLVTARDIGCCAFFETSAKTGYNVKEALSNSVLKCEQVSSPLPSLPLPLTAPLGKVGFLDKSNSSLRIDTIES